jgi:hypothetical protein
LLSSSFVLLRLTSLPSSIFLFSYPHLSPSFPASLPPPPYPSTNTCPSPSPRSRRPRLARLSHGHLPPIHSTASPSHPSASRRISVDERRERRRRASQGELLTARPCRQSLGFYTALRFQVCEGNILITL